MVHCVQFKRMASQLIHVPKKHQVPHQPDRILFYGTMSS